VIDYIAHLIFFEYIWTVQLHVYWRLIVILAYIHTYINTFYLKHEKWSHLSSSSFFCFCIFYSICMCVLLDEDRWRQGWFICLESSFIWGVYYGDFHVSTQKEFICPSYIDMKRRKIIKRKKCEPFLFISLILLIVEKLFFLFFCLFIHKAYSTETLTRNSLLAFFLCRPAFLFLAYVSHILTEMMMCCCCDDRGGVTIFVHLCMSSNEMRRARGYKRKC